MANDTSTYKKFSEVAVSDLTNYLRLAEVSTADTALLTTILEASKSYILTFTGRTVTEANLFPEFTIALYVMAEDMFDKRSYIVDSNTTNETVNSILGMRSMNLL